PLERPGHGASRPRLRRDPRVKAWGNRPAVARRPHRQNHIARYLRGPGGVGSPGKPRPDCGPSGRALRSCGAAWGRVLQCTLEWDTHKLDLNARPKRLVIRAFWPSLHRGLIWTPRPATTQKPAR